MANTLANTYSDNAIERKSTRKGKKFCCQPETGLSKKVIQKSNSFKINYSNELDVNSRNMMMQMIHMIVLMIQEGNCTGILNLHPGLKNVFLNEMRTETPKYLLYRYIKKPEKDLNRMRFSNTLAISDVLLLNETKFHKVGIISTNDGTIHLYLDQYSKSPLNMSFSYSMEELEQMFRAFMMLHIMLDEQQAIHMSLLRPPTNVGKSSLTSRKSILPQAKIFDENLFKEAVTEGDLEMVYSLLGGRLSMHLATSRNELSAFSPLDSKMRFMKIVKLISSKGSDIQSVDELNETNLHKATKAGYISVVKFLLSHGANINAHNLYGETPLHLAAKGNNLTLTKFLVKQKAKFLVFDQKGYTPFHISVINNNLSSVRIFLNDEILINSPDFQCMTALHHAALNNFLEIAKELIENGAHLDTPDIFGQTPLHKACKENNINIVKLLVAKQANVNFKDLTGNTPLILASENGHYEIVKYLIEVKADVNCPNKEFETPLHKAIRIGRLDVANFLLENRASIDFPNKFNSTPLHVALKSDKVDFAKFLVEKGADVHLEDKDGVSALFIYIARGLSGKDINGELHNLLKDKGAVSRNEYYAQRKQRHGSEKRSKMADKLWNKIQKMKNTCTAL